jgi:hypothetical protein
LKAEFGQGPSVLWLIRVLRLCPDRRHHLGGTDLVGEGGLDELEVADVGVDDEPDAEIGDAAEFGLELGEHRAGR